MRKSPLSPKPWAHPLGGVSAGVGGVSSGVGGTNANEGGENPFSCGLPSAGACRVTKHLALEDGGQRSHRPHGTRLPEEQRPRPRSSLLHTPGCVLPGQMARPASQRKKPKLRETSRRTLSLDSEPEPSHGRVRARSRMPHGNWRRKWLVGVLSMPALLCVFLSSQCAGGGWTHSELPLRRCVWAQQEGKKLSY